MLALCICLLTTRESFLQVNNFFRLDLLDEGGGRANDVARQEATSECNIYRIVSFIRKKTNDR